MANALDQLVGRSWCFSAARPPHARLHLQACTGPGRGVSTAAAAARQELHARIAAALEAIRAAAVAPEMLAHHFAEAGEAEKAAHNWLEAGRRALRRSANTEAIAHLTKGIGALTGIPKSKATDRSELQMQLFLGPVLSATRGWSAPEAERAYRRAEVLAQELGADRERFDAVWGLWMIHNTGNEPVAALGITDELFQIADRLDDPALRMEAHHAAWACANTLGDNARDDRAHAARARHLSIRKTWSACILLRWSRYSGVWQGNRRHARCGHSDILIKPSVALTRPSL